MRKCILFLLAIGALKLSAQDPKNDARDRVQVGLKAGVNLANVYDTEGEAFVADSKLGLAAGLYITFPLADMLGFQPEILVSQKGFKASGIILGSPYNIARTSTYIDVPLLFAFRPTSFLSILAGPQYSYLLHQKDVFSNGNITVLQEQEFANDNLRKNMLSFSGGADITINKLVISGRAGWDLQRNAGDGSSTAPRYKNAWYQLTLGYRFYYND